MASYLEDLISNYHIENQINKVIYQIANLIKNDKDYDSAIELILENNLKLENIVTTTIRLTNRQIINLANRIISIKN